MDAEAAADAAVAAAEANVVAAVVIAVAPVAAVVIAVAPVAAVVIGGCVNILYLSVYTYKEVRMLKRNFIHFQQGGAPEQPAGILNRKFGQLAECKKR